MLRRGKHGTNHFGDHIIPYIFRGEQKFCSVRMFYFRMQKFWDYLNPVVYTNITQVDSFYITQDEVKLLKKLNEKYHFGAYTYTTKDTIITLEDTHAFYQYLDKCYKMLVSDGQYYGHYFGYTIFRNRTMLPFIMADHGKVVAVNRATEATRNFVNLAYPLKGWGYHLIKFLCEIQQLAPTTDGDSVLVVPLTILQGCAPDSAFAPFWPSYSNVCCFLDNINESLKVGLLQNFFKNKPKAIDELTSVNLFNF